MRGLGLGLGLSGGGPLWTPKNLSSLVLWAKPDATAILKDFGPNNLASSIGAGTPTYVSQSSFFANAPSARFNGSSAVTFANTAALQIVGDITIVMAINITTHGSLDCLIAKGTSATTCEYDIFAQNLSPEIVTATRRGGTIDQAVTTAGQMVPGTSYIFAFTSTGAGGGQKMYFNSTTQAAMTQSSSGTASATTSALWIGQRSDAATKLTGDIGQVVLCNSVLSATDLSKTMKYVGNQCGISVS